MSLIQDIVYVHTKDHSGGISNVYKYNNNKKSLKYYIHVVGDISVLSTLGDHRKRTKQLCVFGQGFVIRVVRETYQLSIKSTSVQHSFFS